MSQNPEDQTSADQTPENQTPENQTPGTGSRRLPLLFLPDVVVLPGMVVPIELDEAAQTALDAAQAVASGADDAELLVAPRLDDRYASYGVVTTVEKVGRFSRGGPAAVLRAGNACRDRQRGQRPRSRALGRGHPGHRHRADRARP